MNRKKVDVKLKCPDIHDKANNCFRTQCSTCGGQRNSSLEPGIRYVEVEEDEDGAMNLPVLTCPHTGAELNFVSAKDIQNGPTIIVKMSKAQIIADRSSRSKDHFKREILPNMPKEDQTYYKK